MADATATIRDGESASMKHLRRIFVEKFVNSIIKKHTDSTVPHTYGKLTDKMDNDALSVLVNLTKDKLESLSSYAEYEFEALCKEYGLDSKFQQSEANAAALAASSKAKNTPTLRVLTEEQRKSQEKMTPEELTRHRRMMIKKKELAELNEMFEKETELLAQAHENLKTTKEKMMNTVYHDLSSIAPEAQKLLQKCTEN